MTTVGFVGATGLMGHGMAKNIARAGMSLSYTLRSESQRVEEVVDSLLEEPREGLVIVDSSTSEPTSTMKLSERARPGRRLRGRAADEGAGRGGGWRPQRDGRRRGG